MKTVIDLFAGSGGLSLGFEREGFNIVLANEYDKDIAESYIKNRKKSNMFISDIRDKNFQKELDKLKNKIDIVIGGPPCQGFSWKGKKLGLNDPRNFLFKEFYNVVKKIKPKYFLMENVAAMFISEKGYFKEKIKELFEGLGYSLDMQILNIKDYGIPQTRRRAFVLGKLGNKKLSLPEPTKDKVSVWDAISDLAYLNSGEGEFESKYKLEPKSDYQIKLRSKNRKLYNHKATNHAPIVIQRLKMIPPEKGKEHLPKEHLTGSTFGKTWHRLIKDLPAPTITTRYDTPSSGQFTHPYLNRALTDREAARIQSYPDDFIFYGNKSCVMTQIGNSVPPLLSQKIAKVIKQDMMIHE